jgi:hypothetical protein
MNPVTPVFAFACVCAALFAPQDASQSEEIIMPHAGPGETEKWARLLDGS